MFNIAIDGPAGAGKSSIARAAAANLGFIYVDTGALYRTVALAALKRGLKSEDKEEIIALLPAIEVSMGFVDGEQRVFLNGEDVSEDIRLPEVSAAASTVSAIPEVTANHLDASLVHEAAIGRIAGDQLLKLMTLGLTAEEAEEEILNGFLR